MRVHCTGLGYDGPAAQVYGALTPLLPDVEFVHHRAVDAIVGARYAGEGVLLFADAAAKNEAEMVSAGVAAIQAADEAGADHTIFVVGDGYLGSDGDNLGSNLVGAAAVTAARSIATRRGTRRRANVICVPEAFFGRAVSHRAPMPVDVAADDIANAAAFMFGDGGTYLNGQVLFVNGGRQLFSSMTG